MTEEEPELNNVYELEKYRKIREYQKEEKGDARYRYSVSNPESLEKYKDIERTPPTELSDSETEKIILCTLRESTKQDIYPSEEELREIIEWANKTIRSYILVCGLVNDTISITYDENGDFAFKMIEQEDDDEIE